MTELRRVLPDEVPALTGFVGEVFHDDAMISWTFPPDGMRERSVRFFDASQRPYEPPDIVMLAKQDPIKTQTVDRLDYLSSRGIADGLPNDNVALVAEAVVELPAGELILRTISDDGVRAYVDGKLVIDRWDVHESVVDETPIRGGRRKLRLEYFDRTGWAELRVEIVKHRTLP